MKKTTILIILLNILFFSQAQTKKEILQITKDYNLKYLNDLSLKLKKQNVKNKLEAVEFAKKNNLPISYTDKNGVFYELQRLFDGKPQYYKTYNAIAAKSTRANFLYNNGGLGLNIEGQGMTAFIWDGGRVKLDHVEFNNGGTSKVTIADASTMAISDHATHVLGTMIAKGVNSTAKGMAPKASAYSFDWNNDDSEAASSTAFGLLVSNHSYGFALNDAPDWAIGAYVSLSKDWDNIMYNAPYYLVVAAAGNDGSDGSSNASPLDGNWQYDKLTYMSTSKNSLIIANGQDPNVSNQGVFTSNTYVSGGSSQGPTDDYRIKPDLTGNGVSVFSSTAVSTNSYDSYNGTSMASPNVCGSLLLLQQLYNQEKSNFMLAATLKGLALHTATDIDFLNGPDARSGWGYMNTKFAAETILNSNAIISEETLNNNATKTFNITAIGNEPIMASISWTDKPPTNVNTGVINDHTPVLVNDLDIRIIRNGTTYMPWKMTGVNSNAKADNIVDPFERIDIDNPNANDIYTVTISHKGNLNNNLQNYSLILTGITANNLSLHTSKITDFKIYPNPSNNGIINIAVNSNDNYKIITTNVLGEIVNKTLLKNNIQPLDYSRLDKGVYFITIFNTNSKTTKKLILK